MHQTTDVMIEDPHWADVDLPMLAESAARGVLEHLGMDPNAYEIAILACDDARISVLNTDFRAKASATNVLSWPSQERGAQAPGHAPDLPDADDPELGDIAIAYGTCAKEASEGKKPLADHVTHLIVHATLHLLGYDHECDQDATLMEGLETAILGKMGLSDPYA